MPSAAYCRAILTGMMARGFSRAEILTVAALGEGELAEILAERRSFSDDVLVRIEGASGMTGGQLAAASVDHVPDAAARVFDAWAEAKEGATSGETTVHRR